mgnify:CR=1 FL=1
MLNNGDPYWDLPAPAKNHGEGGGLFRSLSHEDLKILRRVIRKVHRSHGWPKELCDDHHCDMVIESIGAETAEKLIAEGKQTRILDK